jgi:hypothetical protein
MTLPNLTLDLSSYELLTYIKQKSNLEGQRDRKVDDSKDIVPLEPVAKKVCEEMERARKAQHKSQTEIAKLCNMKENDYKILEKGGKLDKTVVIPWGLLQKNLGVMLRGTKNIGAPYQAGKKGPEKPPADNKSKEKK